MVEEWSVHELESRDAAEQELRASDLIVSLVEPDGPESPNSYFEYGVATMGCKGLVAVTPLTIRLKAASPAVPVVDLALEIERIVG